MHNILSKGWKELFNEENLHLIFARMPTLYVQSALKRSIDIVFSLLALPVAAPLVVVLGILVKLTSKGPVFYSQERIGKDNRPFTIYKMRTLRADNQDPYAGMRKGDKAVVPFGYFLRQSRIDELPQIWNILCGDMSWIGPRPEQTALVAETLSLDPTFAQRHAVRPGITGLAQVHNPNATPRHNQEKLVKDLEYIHTASVWMDLGLLLRSVVAIFK